MCLSLSFSDELALLTVMSGYEGFLALTQPQVDRLADFAQVIAWPCIIFSQS